MHRLDADGPHERSLANDLDQRSFPPGSRAMRSRNHRAPDPSGPRRKDSAESRRFEYVVGAVVESRGQQTNRVCGASVRTEMRRDEPKEGVHVESRARVELNFHAALERLRLRRVVAEPRIDLRHGLPCSSVRGVRGFELPVDAASVFGDAVEDVLFVGRRFGVEQNQVGQRARRGLGIGRPGQPTFDGSTRIDATRLPESAFEDECLFFAIEGSFERGLDELGGAVRFPLARRELTK